MTKQSKLFVMTRQSKFVWNQSNFWPVCEFRLLIREINFFTIFKPNNTGGAVLPGRTASQLKVGGGCKMPTTLGVLMIL